MQASATDFLEGIQLSDESTLRLGTQEKFIEISATIERDRSLQSHGDARLTIAVQSNGFSARNAAGLRRSFAPPLRGVDFRTCVFRADYATSDGPHSLLRSRKRKRSSSSTSIGLLR
jgi:hypothetical protein